MDEVINYIIYEDEEEYRKKYISIILKLRGKEQEGYRIIMKKRKNNWMIF